MSATRSRNEVVVHWGTCLLAEFKWNRKDNQQFRGPLKKATPEWKLLEVVSIARALQSKYASCAARFSPGKEGTHKAVDSGNRLAIFNLLKPLGQKTVVMDSR